jgi:hypothetical protein
MEDKRKSIKYLKRLKTVAKKHAIAIWTIDKDNTIAQIIF